MSRRRLSPAQYVPRSITDVVLGHGRVRGIALRILAVLLAIYLWDQLAATQPAYVFPDTGAILDAFVQQYREGLIEAFVGSMRTLALGFGLAVAVGIPVGLLMGINRYAEVVLDPYVTALYIAPVAALVPLLIFALGATFATRVVIVFLFAVFEITIDTYKGAKATPRDSIDVARSFGASRLFVIRNVILPYDLPYIFTGLRLGIGRGIKGLVLAELLINFANLGAIIRSWEDSFQISGVFSVAILLMLLGITLTKTLQFVEGRLFAWSDHR